VSTRGHVRTGRSMVRWRRAGARLTVTAALLAGTAVATAEPVPVLALAGQAQGAAEEGIPAESTWPHQVSAGTTTLVVYQPQLDTFDGYDVTARAAVEAKEAGGKSAAYGIVHVKARALVDKGSRTVVLDDYQITKANFPSAETESAAWVQALQQDASTKSKTMSLDRLEALVGAVETQKRADAGPLRNVPPRIVFSTVPALLVYIDGEPVLRPLKETSLQRVINTRPLLLKDAHGRYYLHVFDGWMSASSLEGSWTRDPSPTADLEKAEKEAVAARNVDLLTGQTSPDEKAPSLAKGPVPAIHVATTPTELVVTQGEPDWTPLEGTDLLYVSNTTGHIFKEIGDQKTYVLVSGRWFRAPDTSGPWEFVAANALPADFRNIPNDSPQENVKASVAGTPQAEEAAIAASIPQTSIVKKSEVKMSPPVFDGQPEMRAIPGTSLQYVVNTATPILMVDAHSWYAVENGVWFVSGAVKGPWLIASSVPAVIYSIPYSSPLHYVTYVKVYGSTPDTVVVGYTPGYQGTCIDPVTNVVVYGTGYAYTPWVGTAWYGPPVTYGFGVSIRYTPFTGWTFGFGFGLSWGGATVAVGWGWGAHPWWGPYGWGYSWGPRLYPAPYAWGGAAYGVRGGAMAWGPGGWAGTTGNIYSQWGPRSTVTRASGGYNAWTGNRWATQVGSSYNSRTGIASAGQRGAVQNVYTGNYAAGARGIATGPGGTTAVGQRGTVGNAYTGREVSGNRGEVYDPWTGRGTSVAGVHGNSGGAERVGDDVYGYRDGNVYRRNDGGWQRRSGGGWDTATAPAGLERESAARRAGNWRSGAVHSSWGGMRGGFRGGFRRR
jgi:hypothetical protein